MLAEIMAPRRQYEREMIGEYDKRPIVRMGQPPDQSQGKANAQDGSVRAGRQMLIA